MSRSPSAISMERAFMGATAAIMGVQVWAQAFAAGAAALGLGWEAQASVTMTVLGSVATAAAMAACRRRAPWRWSVLAGLAAAAVQLVLFPGLWAAALALALAVAGASAAGGLIAARLPAQVDGAWRRHRRWTLAWGLLALVTVVQLGRLAAYMGNPEVDWFLTTRNPFWAKHECLPAYFQAAGLAADSESNIYHTSHYPGLDANAKPQPVLDGMVVEDPFQYAPQFLVWPYLAMHITSDYQALRLGWFALHSTFLLLVALALARWMGGRAGRTASLLSPLVLIAFPALHTLQYGQFHLVAIGLAVLAMMAFERGRTSLGAGLLAISVLSKLFPAILLVVLAAQRRFRALAYTGIAGVVLTGASLAIFGRAPFTAFFDYHLARLADGAAFAFGEAWPEIATLIVADNQGFYGLIVKLGALGVAGAGKATAALFAKIVGVALVGLAVWFGHRRIDASRADRAIAWLGLLGLASMLSTGAFGDYVPATATWLLTLVAHRVRDDRRLLWLLLPSWALQFFLLGTSPLGDWFHAPVLIPISFVAVLSMAALFTWTTLGARPLPARARDGSTQPVSLSSGRLSPRAARPSAEHSAR